MCSLMGRMGQAEARSPGDLRAAGPATNVARKSARLWPDSRFRRCRPASSREVFRNQPLDNHHIEPLAVELRVLFVDADFPKPAPCAERPAGGIGGKDPGDELPVAAVARGVDERRQQPAADAAAPGVAIEIDGELADARVTGPRPIAAQAR